MDIQIDTSGLVKKFDTMLTQIEHFKCVDIGEELTAWQVDDMHRQRPSTQVECYEDFGTAATVIHPRSVLAQSPQGRRILRRQQRSRQQSRSGSRRFSSPSVSRSARPILRPELEDKLARRVRLSMDEKIKWR